MWLKYFILFIVVLTVLVPDRRSRMARKCISGATQQRRDQVTVNQHNRYRQEMRRLRKLNSVTIGG